MYHWDYSRKDRGVFFRKGMDIEKIRTGRGIGRYPV